MKSTFGSVISQSIRDSNIQMKNISKSSNHRSGTAPQTYILTCQTLESKHHTMKVMISSVKNGLKHWKPPSHTNDSINKDAYKKQINISDTPPTYQSL